MTSAEEIVSTLSDNQAASLAKRIHNRLFSNIHFADIKENTQNDADAALLLSLTPQQYELKFDANTSTQLVRQFLVTMANDPETAPVIVDTWQEVIEDDSMFVGTVVAVGLMVNLTLFMISSELEVNIGSLKIRKKTVDSDAVKAVMEPVKSLLNLGKTA